MNDASYEADRKFGDKFMLEVTSILGRALYTTEYQTEDTERNTDLIIISMSGKRVGVRIRRNKYFSMYDNVLDCPLKDEFTIRYTKESGHKTEFRKMLADGFGDYFFYGFADEDETHLIKWVLLDYQAIRRFCIESLWRCGSKFIADRIHRNWVNDDQFIVFKVDEINDGIVADSDHWVPVLA